MKTTTMVFRSGFFALAAAVLLCAAGTSRGEKRYKPVRVPVIPGVREIAQRDQEKRIAPYLEGAGGDALFASDLSSEVSKGATNSAAALGNGRLSALISPWAELTVLRWPSPLYGDQLRYFTLPGTRERPVRMVEDAPSLDWRRYGHPQEPCPGLGSRGGLGLDSGELSWLGDPTWSSERGFEPEDSMTLVTRLSRPGLEVEVIDFIDPELDLMVRQFKIHGPARRFFYHGTFAPRVPDPAEGVDWDPPDAGFAAALDRAGLAYEAVMAALVEFALGQRQPLLRNPKPCFASAASSTTC